MSTERILKDIDDCQWLLLARLADEAEERNDSVWAGGWRYLAEARRWPIAVQRHDEGDEGPAWEWWRERSECTYSCSLPRLLMDHVRKQSKTAASKPPRFNTPGAALACAAFWAGNLINLFGSVE